MDDWLRHLATSLAGPPSLALALLGSHARGEAGAYSDVDLLRFDPEEPTAADRYRLMYLGGRLVSLTVTTFPARRAELTRPESAIWAVPGLRLAVPLLDRDGQLAQLLQAARDFSWAPLQPAADRHAARLLTDHAEEAHKLLGALQRGSEPTAVWALAGLVPALNRAVAVQRGLLIQTENELAARVAAAFPDPWPAWAEQAWGMGRPTTVAQRVAAALQMYACLARRWAPLLDPEQAQVVTETARRIAAAGPRDR